MTARMTSPAPSMLNLFAGILPAQHRKVKP
jgi:hypothetical protein